METLLDASHDIAMLANINGIALAANKNAAESFGLSIKALIGKNIYKLMPPAVAAARKKAAKTVISSGKPISHTEKSKGRIKHFHVKPVVDNQGNVSGLAIFSKDITKQKKAEEALKKAHDELECRVVERTK